MPEVNSHNPNDYAGNLGNNMGGLRAKPTYGEINIQVHTAGGGWLEKVDSRNSDSGGVNSYAGIYGRVIDAIRMK